MPSPVPLPTTLGVFVTNSDMAPLPEMISAVSPVPVGLADAWNAIKDGPKVAKASGEFDTIGVSSVP